MAVNRPRGRQKNVSGQGKGVKRRGSGLGTGPVGSSGGYSGRPGGRKPSGGMFGNLGGSGSPGGSGDMGGSGNMGGGPRVTRSGGGCSKFLILIVFLLFAGGGGIGSLFSGSGSGGGLFSDGGFGDYISSEQNQNNPYGDLSTLLGGLGGGSISSGWDNGSNAGSLNTSVDSSARDKYTQIRGNGRDEVTLMVYLCGTDLESRSKMATSDLQEMINADLSDKVNLIVYTGGCRAWQNNAVSSKTNQIWQVKNDGIVCLEKDLGNKSMTDPNTLVSFIKSDMLSAICCIIATTLE